MLFEYKIAILQVKFIIQQSATLYLQQSNIVVKINLQLRTVLLKGHKSI